MQVQIEMTDLGLGVRALEGLHRQRSNRVRMFRDQITLTMLQSKRENSMYFHQAALCYHMVLKRTIDHY